MKRSICDPWVTGRRAAFALLMATLGMGSIELLRAQDGAPAAQAANQIPRTADGKPDFTGFWQAMTTANDNILPHSATYNVPAGLGVVEGNELPYLPGARAKVNENFANRAKLDTESRCFLPGVPRIMYMPFPFQVVQTGDRIMMLFEYLHAVRNIYMSKEHPKGPIEWWMGDSRGKWEGDTLVVDVVHFNTETWFDRAGNYHSDEMHIVERYSLMDRDHISYSATIEDPKVFSRPWKMNLVLYRHREPGFQLLDYECYAFRLNDEPIIPPARK
jgi:hypothetical protein